MVFALRARRATPTDFGGMASTEMAATIKSNTVFDQVTHGNNNDMFCKIKSHITWILFSIKSQTYSMIDAIKAEKAPPPK